MTTITTSVDQDDTRPVYMYIPSNLDLSRLLPDHLKQHADCVHYLVHCVICGRVFWRHDDSGFVPLKVEYLRKCIPDRVEKDLRQWTIDSGVLECDGRYLKGKKSLGYRLAEPYRVRSRRIECRDRNLAERILQLRGTEHRHEVELDVHRYLKEWYLRLDVDQTMASQIIETLEHPDIHHAAVQMIADHHEEFSYCNKGRVHTVVTRLARELRPALRMNGERLVNVDIANCQPLILAMILLAYRSSKDQFLKTEPLEEERTTNPYLDTLVFSGSSHSSSSSVSTAAHHLGPHRHAGTTPSTSITMSNSDSECTDSENTRIRRLRSVLREDEQRYVELCEQGRFYEYLQEEAKLADVPRDEMKVRFYTEVFFGRNQVVTDLVSYHFKCHH